MGHDWCFQQLSMLVIELVMICFKAFGKIDP